MEEELKRRGGETWTGVGVLLGEVSVFRGVEGGEEGGVGGVEDLCG